MSDLERLREVCTALGWAPNPNDFHSHVQACMWTVALDDIRGHASRSGRIYRENQQLVAEVRRLRGAGPRPVTDAEVDAAMRTLDPRGLGGPGGMRAALEAARAVQPIRTEGDTCG